MCLRFLGRLKRFAAVGGSDGVLRGFGEWLEEDLRGRFCMLNRRNYTRNRHDWNPMPDMEFESLRGVRIFGRGFAKKGGSDEPPLPTPLGYGPGINLACSRRAESKDQPKSACITVGLLLRVYWRKQNLAARRWTASIRLTKLITSVCVCGSHTYRPTIFKMWTYHSVW